jgi:hypothetical protein
MKIRAGFFWVVALCSDVVGTKVSEDNTAPHFQPEDGDNMFLRNAGILRHCTASQRWKPQLEEATLSRLYEVKY